MCRSTERAYLVRVECHPDSRSRGVWSTAFDEAGQGELFGDVVSFADDADGRAALVAHIVEDVTMWITSQFRISVGGGDYQ